MSKKRDLPFQGGREIPPERPYDFSQTSDNWQSQLSQVALRFNRQYRKEPFDLPGES